MTSQNIFLHFDVYCIFYRRICTGTEIWSESKFRVFGVRDRSGNAHRTEGKERSRNLFLVRAFRGPYDIVYDAVSGLRQFKLGICQRINI